MTNDYSIQLNNLNIDAYQKQCMSLELKIISYWQKLKRFQID